MVAQNPDDPGGNPIEIIPPKAKINTIEAYPFTVGITNVKFKIVNYYVEPSYIKCKWNLYKASDGTLVKKGESNILKDKSSGEIKIESLSSNTKYQLKIEAFKIVVDFQDETEVSLGTITRNFSTNKSDEDKDQVKKESELAGQSRDFSYLYDTIPTLGRVHDVSGWGLHVTKLSSANIYYRSPLAGVNNCTTDLINIFFSTSVLPNCVGYAHGRIKEIWGRNAALDRIKKDSSGWYVTNTGQRITGEIVGVSLLKPWENQWPLASPQPPNCNAANWWENWPTNEGWTKSQTPVLGAVMCWGGGWRNCGHVAVVEQIDYSTGDVIASEGYSATDSSPGSIGHVNKYYKSNNYSMGGSYSFKGFLVSPVCYISGSVGGFFEDILIDINSINVDEHDQATYNEIAHKHHTILNEALSINDRVEIQWFGNTKADGKGKSIGNLTLVGQITNINTSAPFPYEITINKKVAGYYPRSSLIKTTAALSTSLNSSIDSIQTNKDVAVTAKVMTSDLRIRSGPGTNYDILGKIAEGAIVNIYDTRTNGKYDWYKISKDHEQWIANTKGSDGKYWVQTQSASLVNNGETEYKKYKFTTQVKIRTSPEILDDDSNVLPKPYKQNGEVINVYQVNALGQKPVGGEPTYWMYPPTGLDKDNYVWRRVGDNQWINDIKRDGYWEVPITYESDPATPVNPVKKLYLNPMIELRVRDFPGFNGKILEVLPATTTGYEIGPWYNQQSNAGYTWYRISQYEDRWIGDKYDPDIKGHYVTIK